MEQVKTGAADDVRLVMNRRARKQDVDRLERGLVAHNERQAPHTMRFEHFTIMAHDRKGRVVGGLDGYMYWDWLFVFKLWCDARVRRKGLGGRILRAGEEHARKYGCHSVWLDTLSFQARPFYEKQGYRCFGELDDYPPGHQRFFMCKRLGPVRKRGAQRKSAPTASATVAKPSRSRRPANSAARRRGRAGPS